MIALLCLLHEKKIIYRNLHPSTIFLTEKGNCKVSDFSGSNFEIKKSKNKRKTFIGVPEYFAPEMLTNEGYDRRVDIW